MWRRDFKIIVLIAVVRCKFKQSAFSCLPMQIEATWSFRHGASLIIKTYDFNFPDTCVNVLMKKLFSNTIIKTRKMFNMKKFPITETNIWKISKFLAFLFKSAQTFSLNTPPYCNDNEHFFIHAFQLIKFFEFFVQVCMLPPKKTACLSQLSRFPCEFENDFIIIIESAFNHFLLHNIHHRKLFEQQHFNEFLPLSVNNFPLEGIFKNEGNLALNGKSRQNGR